MKKKAHNLQFADNDWFLFRIVGKHRLSVSEEYLVFLLTWPWVKGQVQHIGQNIEQSVSVSTLRTGSTLLHLVSQCYSEINTTQYFDIHGKSLLPSSIPAHILQGGRSTYFAQFISSKVQTLQPDWYTMWQLMKFSDDLLSAEDLANCVCSLNCMTLIRHLNTN